MICRKRRTIKIGRRLIGDGCPVFTIAETGTNHNGNVELAIKMIEAAKRCQADAVKFQPINADVSYIKGTPPYNIYKKARFTQSEWLRIKNAADKNRILFFGAPADIPSARLFRALKPPLVKISSGSMTNIALVREIAKYGVPVMISTGMAYLEEVENTVKELEKSGVKQIMILHCVSLYPAQRAQLNLNAITALRNAFCYPIGFSDHTRQDLASVAAIGLGACILEKHFTIDKRAGGPEQGFSYTESQLKRWVEAVRYTEAALGVVKKVPSKDEMKLRDKNRRCLVANVNIRKGEIITEQMLGMKRPLTKPGLNTAYFEKVLGKRATADINKNQPIYKFSITS